MSTEKTNRYIAAFYVVLMSIQIIPLEGYTVSTIKFIAICLCPLIWLLLSPKITTVHLVAGVYFLAMLFVGLYHKESFRFTTVGYSLSYTIMFATYHNLIYLERAFSIDFFMRLIKNIILAYFIVLILQQIVHLAGIGYFPLINSIVIYKRGWLAGNSLGIEPSISARTLGVLFLALLRMYEIKWGREKVTLKSIYADDKYTCIGFIWTMITMGSGTAFITLILLSCYFIRKQFLIIAIPVIIVCSCVIPYINYEPLQRAIASIEATMTLDQEAIYKADGSASTRIIPIVNTLTDLDITDKKTWLGHGIDTGVYTGDVAINTKVMIGGISDYGLVVFVISLIFIYSYCIKGVFGLESIMYFILLEMAIRNMAFIWGIFMIWTTVRYFQINYAKEFLK